MGLFDLFRGKKKTQTQTAAQPNVNWTPLVDKLAHYQSFSLDRTEEQELEKQLLAGGNDALQAIVTYLRGCGYGMQSQYWWNDAALLVRMIAKFPGQDPEPVYRSLMSVQTNIWEYHTQIKDVAEQELLKLKKAAGGAAGGRIPAENAMAELKQLYNMRCSENERLEKVFAMRPSVDSWSDESKAFYYYIIGDALRVRDKTNERSYPFYAAQVFYQPVATSLGWHELKQSGKFPDLTPSEKNAKMIHKKLPLPENWDELMKSN